MPDEADAVPVAEETIIDSTPATDASEEGTTYAIEEATVDATPIPAVESTVEPSTVAVDETPVESLAVETPAGESVEESVAPTLHAEEVTAVEEEETPSPQAAEDLSTIAADETISTGKFKAIVLFGAL